MSKVRSDSWAGQLTLDEQAEIYESWIAFKGKWEDFADWIAKTYENARRPSRTSLYDWAGDNDEGEPGPGKSAYLQVRSARIRSAGQQMVEWAKSRGDVMTDDIAQGFLSLACEAQSTGSLKERSSLVGDYCNLVDRILKQKDLDLKAKAQATKDDQLKLAREKFEAAEKRLNAAKDTANDTKLTNEEKLARMKEIFG